jgi:TPR repeat protein
MMRVRGEGVLPDKARGYAWVRKAAEQAYPQAQAVLADAYRSGDIGQADPAQAQRWAELSARQGNALGQFVAGLLETEPVRRKQYLRASAEQGHAEAQAKLAVELLKTPSTATITESMDWLGKAAIQGHAGAQCNLAGLTARMAAVDEAAEVNRRAWLRDAYKWFLICERSPGREPEIKVERALELMEKDMLDKVFTPQEQAEARQEAAGFRPSSRAVYCHGYFEGVNAAE